MSDIHELKAAFQESIAKLELAHEAWMTEGFVGTVKRERAIGESLLLLGRCFGIDLDPYLCVNSLGEISLNVEPESPAEKRINAVGEYGKNFALFLSQYSTRTGVSMTKGHVHPENGWCWINHFQAEKMLMDFSHQLHYESHGEFTDVAGDAIGSDGEPCRLQVVRMPNGQPAVSDGMLTDYVRIDGPGQFVLESDQLGMTKGIRNFLENLTVYSALDGICEHDDSSPGRLKMGK